MRGLLLVFFALLFVSLSLGQANVKFEFQDVCGSPVVESQIYPMHFGVVTRILDGDTIQVRDKYGKVWTVEIAGVDTSDEQMVASAYLTKTILNKKVTFAGNPDKNIPGTSIIEAMITRKKLDLNRFLIEKGYGRYRSTDYGYAVSDYKMCVLDKLESKAKSMGLGIWAKRN